MNKYEELKQEFSNLGFREHMKSILGNKCVNCGSTDNIEYHHIVPLINGGTNKLSNIVPLCDSCHYKAHDKNKFKTRKAGRNRLVNYKDAESILHKYYKEEIGTKECKQLLGISINNKSTWYTLRKEYEMHHQVDENFYNHIDILNAQLKKQKNN